MPDISVVICTYNGEARLPQVLEKLRSPKPDCRWEIVIIDNNSQDRTAAVIAKLQHSWRTDVPLRYCFEPEQGLAFARRRAIREVCSPLIGFLDDDTLPDANWVSAAVHFGQQHPEAGAYGSSIEGVYETAPPPNFERIACCLAIINRGDRPFQYSSVRGVLPAGAGMVIRRQAWLAQVPAKPALAGVKAGSLKAKGEDVETLTYIRQAWAIWHNPAMKLRHIIPKERLERDYLLNLFWQIGLSRYPLRRVRYRRWQWPFIVPIYFLNDLRKSCWHLSTKLSMRPFETVEACEFSLLLGSSLSPFFYCRRTLATGPVLNAIALPMKIGQHLL